MEENTKFYVIVGLFAIVIILFGVLVLAKTPSEIKLIPQETDNDHVISVQGYAEEKVSPNEAYIYFTIETKAETAKEAQTKNAEIWDALKKQFNNKDYLKYQTESYNVWPDQEWDENTRKTITTGYVVNNSIKVTLTDISESGNILDIIVKSGVNNVNTISFGLSQEEQNKIKQALWKEAVDDAKDRAETVANAAGATLVQTPKSITLNEYSYNPYPYYRYDYAMAEKGYDTQEAGNTEVTPQELTVSVSLSLVYEYS